MSSRQSAFGLSTLMEHLGDLATKTLPFGLKKFPDHPLLKQELQALVGKLVA